MTVPANVESPELQTIKELADEIRQMDGLIFQLSQTMDPTYLCKLLEEHVEPRMKRESDRISDIMRRELLTVYAPRLERK